ncbi:MAG: phosphodiesterase [Gammaproteobacteria bacterium]|nr:phosphodiesterase [Gammaproteobacteria bacterium]MDH5777742.1 phosphodiesterase [Gammaproteobacteria bacterium]
MLRRFIFTLALLLGFGLAMPGYAETVDVPVPEEEKENFSVTLPGRGMTMEAVEERFGAPEERHEQVGTPPITRWIYKTFTVYFEDKYVIHAVFHTPK